MKDKKINLLDYEPGQIKSFLQEAGESPFRTGQIIKWIYEKKADKFSGFSNLPASLREKLKSSFVLRSLTLAGKKASKQDGTVKYNFKTFDGNVISSVFLPYESRNSACISTQAGCGIGCAFCATGAMGLKRDLDRGEILEQILQIEKDAGTRISGVLLMGMGEPLANYQNTVSALRALTDPKMFGIGRRHITISTAGLVPFIKRFAGEKTGVRLALSLHSADDKTRAKLVPYRKVPYSAAQILDACLNYSRESNSKFTIEYVMICGMNDSREDAEKLANLIKSHKKQGDQIQVNLIPYNKTEGCRYTAPAGDAAEKFKAFLTNKKIFCVMRQPRGADIGAACGQLGV